MRRVGRIIISNSTISITAKVLYFRFTTTINLTMSTATLVVFGSGPGIGISIAKLFAQKHFDHIALCARSADRLASEKAEVEDAAKKVGRTVQVSTHPTDLSNLASLTQSLKEIEKLGPLGVVYHNAARINPSEPLSAPVEEIEEDFKVSVVPLSRATIS